MSSRDGEDLKVGEQDEYTAANSPLAICLAV